MVDEKTLIERAWKALSQAYAPYSKFKVGAALLCSNDEIFTGCNIESGSFSLTICAERCALFKALSEGMPKDSFIKMVIVSSSDTPAYPCGACRQVLWEWAPNLQIVTISKNGKSKEISLKSLFPKPFRFDF